MSRTTVNCFTLPPNINILQIPNSNGLLISDLVNKRNQLINMPNNMDVLACWDQKICQPTLYGVFDARKVSNLCQNSKKETSIKKRKFRSLHALTSALVRNAVMDSANPSSKSIRIGGVGYYAELEKKPTCGDSCSGTEYILSLKLGYTHKVRLQVPKTLDIKIEKDATTIIISGMQRCFLGNFAARVRSVSPIEPYHKKGLSYVNEVVRSKVAKSRKNKAKE
jgi:ribosomal protein L6P/L9E